MNILLDAAEGIEGLAADVEAFLGTSDPGGLIGKYPYSGADIKLVVHLPHDAGEEGSTEEDELMRELEEAQAELVEAPLVRGGARSSMEEDISNLRGARLSHIAEIARLTEEDEEGNAASILALTEDAALIQTEINELTPIINRTLSETERSTIETEIERIAAAIEALREEGEGGPEPITKVLAEVQTLSISNFREKFPVRTLGSVYPKSFCRGPRTIGGSMVFTTFHSHIFNEFFGSRGVRSTGVGDWDRFHWSTNLADQLPPLDISISFANEYGNVSWMAIYGVEFTNEGLVMSIEDIFLEGTVQYVARDWDPIRSVANRPYSHQHGVGRELSGSNLLKEDLRKRVAGRRNPFI